MHRAEILLARGRQRFLSDKKLILLCPFLREKNVEMGDVGTLAFGRSKNASPYMHEGAPPLIYRADVLLVRGNKHYVIVLPVDLLPNTEAPSQIFAHD